MMFSFHKPKVYRSSTGCCICKAKSSSSRFTDSKKYEDDFIKCFLLEEQRTGEICNACVLLVKRFKKLPPGSTRNWAYIVDGRAGPGVKSLTKYKSKNKKKLKDNPEKIVKKKHVYVKSDDRERSPVISDDLHLNEDYLNGTESKGSSRSETPEDCDDIEMTESTTERVCTDNNDDLAAYSFIDMDYFKRTTICCGVIFRGLCNEVIVVPELIKRCSSCILRQRQRQLAQTGVNTASNSPFHSSALASPAYRASSSSPAHSVDSTDASANKSTGKVFSDNSSDSGYDESSNQGVGESKIAQNNINNSTNMIDSGKINSIKIKPTPTTETVRLVKVPIKIIKSVEKFTNESTFVSSKSLTSTNGHSHVVINNPLDDFATHAVARQSVIN